MWVLKGIKEIDLRVVAILIVLMMISLFVISSTTSEGGDFDKREIFSPQVMKQLYFFGIGWGCFLFFSLFDYRKLYEWTWILYVVTLLLLIGVFFVPTIQSVHRWYRIGSFTFQPSELGKLAVVITLSWFLSRKVQEIGSWKVSLQALLIVMMPFGLIYLQPDLGTALVLFPITLVMFYLGGVRRSLVVGMGGIGLFFLAIIALLFSGLVDHEAIRPYATKIVKDYQYERLNPNTYHQQAAATAISLGGVLGSGWHKSMYTKGQWLPASHTDSVFPAYAEEFGLVGVIFLLAIFYSLLYTSFQVTKVAKDRFGRLLSAGIAVYIGMHVLVNFGMMCGFLPITGVPLVMISYGGSSVLVTMSGMGILQSIYRRRFTF